MHYIAVFTTVDSEEIANKMASHLVESNLAACVHIENISSVYQWQGKTQRDSEWRLVCKTTSARYSAVESAIKSLHPYQLPAIYALPFSHIDPVFSNWISEQTQTK